MLLITILTNEAVEAQVEEVTYQGSTANEVADLVFMARFARFWSLYLFIIYHVFLV